VNGAQQHPVGRDERQGGALEGFFDLLSGAPARVLLLDYDGTLAPFRVERDQAVPYEGVREAVRRMLGAGHTRVVVISGRTIADLRPLLGVEPPPELWGTHGWERMEPGGPLRLRELEGAQRTGLERARGAVPVDPARVEAKPASVAVHVRGLAQRESERVLAAARDAWTPIARDAGLALHPFDGGLELRARGWDKGDAVRAVLAQEPPGTAVAYLGDDLTDEDAFSALDELADGSGVRALGVLVRGERRPSRARAWLRPPEDLLAFLDRWNRSAS
jgi:trehalose 6-phosphate phosphatase